VRVLTAIDSRQSYLQDVVGGPKALGFEKQASQRAFSYEMVLCRPTCVEMGIELSEEAEASLRQCPAKGLGVKADV
jgi:hypothetical protein